MATLNTAGRRKLKILLVGDNENVLRTTVAELSSQELHDCTAPKMPGDTTVDTVVFDFEIESKVEISARYTCHPEETERLSREVDAIIAFFPILNAELTKVSHSIAAIQQREPSTSLFADFP